MNRLSSFSHKFTKAIASHLHLPTIVIMTTSLISTILITTIPTSVARLNMRDVYRIDLGSQKASPTKADNNLFSTE